MDKKTKIAIVLNIVAIIFAIVSIAISLSNSKKYPQRYCPNCGYEIGTQISYSKWD